MEKSCCSSSSSSISSSSLSFSSRKFITSDCNVGFTLVVVRFDTLTDAEVVEMVVGALGRFSLSSMSSLFSSEGLSNLFIATESKDGFDLFSL